MIKMLLALALAFVLAVVGICLAAFWLAGPPKDCTPYEPLRGRDLACWCKLGDPCHADILLEMANQ